MTRPSGALRRVVLREDYLGASTYVEKGWNLIAIGDFSGAEVALLHALDLAHLWKSTPCLGADAPGHIRLGGTAAHKDSGGGPLHAMARVNPGYVQMRKREFMAALELLESSSQQIRDPKAALYARFYLGLLFSPKGISGRRAVLQEERDAGAEFHRRVTTSLDARSSPVDSTKMPVQPGKLATQPIVSTSGESATPEQFVLRTGASARRRIADGSVSASLRNNDALRSRGVAA